MYQHGTHGEYAQPLGEEFLRIVGEVRPAGVIRENTWPERTGAACGADWFAGRLEGLGYTAACVEIRACCLGADHRRSRMFVLAQLPDAHSLDRWSRCQNGEPARDGREQAGDEASNRRRRWPAKSGIPRTAHGVAYRVDRHEAIGEGQVPVVVRAAWELLTQ